MRGRAGTRAPTAAAPGIRDESTPARVARRHAAGARATRQTGRATAARSVASRRATLSRETCSRGRGRGGARVSNARGWKNRPRENWDGNLPGKWSLSKMVTFKPPRHCAPRKRAGRPPRGLHIARAGRHRHLTSCLLKPATSCGGGSRVPTKKARRCRLSLSRTRPLMTSATRRALHPAGRAASSRRCTAQSRRVRRRVGRLLRLLRPGSCPTSPVTDAGPPW